VTKITIKVILEHVRFFADPVTSSQHIRKDFDDIQGETRTYMQTIFEVDCRKPVVTVNLVNLLIRNV